MTIENTRENSNKKNTHSKLGILSFASALITLSLTSLNIIVNALSVNINNALKSILPILFLLAILTTFITSIIDISSKNRRKILSIIALTISLLYIGLGFLMVLAFMLYNPPMA